MSILYNYLNDLANSDEEIAEILKRVGEISKVVEAAQEVVNYKNPLPMEDNNSANVKLSFRASPLSSVKWGVYEKAKQKQAE